LLLCILQKRHGDDFIINSQPNVSIKNKLENHCWKMWHSCVITWDGDVVPCCFDKDAKIKLGSIAHNSFQKAWKSKK